MEKFYMIWVAGKGVPKIVHDSIDGARDAARHYKSLGGTREVHILAPVETLPGRKLLTIKPRVTVEPR